MSTHPRSEFDVHVTVVEAYHDALHDHAIGEATRSLGLVSLARQQGRFDDAQRHGRAASGQLLVAEHHQSRRIAAARAARRAAPDGPPGPPSDSYRA